MYSDTCRRRNETAQGSCESQDGSSVEKEQHAQEPLTKTANLTLGVRFSNVQGLLQQWFHQGMLETLWDNTRNQRGADDICYNRNQGVQAVKKAE